MKRRNPRRVQAIVGLLMLPISLIPFALYFHNTAEGKLLWTRATLRYFPPHLPEVRVAATSPNGGFQPYRDAVATLVYHGIGTTTDAEGQFSLSISRFAEQLATLRAAGAHFVTAREVAIWRQRGQAPPTNAVLITFDDGRAEAMMLADPLLRAAHAKATMFVIADAVENPGIYYATGEDLERYGRSGRWDLQSHTANLHDTQDTAIGPLPLLTSLAPRESLAQYRRRVIADLDRADAFIRSVTGQRPVAFAYPFGAYGGDRTNHVRIRATLRSIIGARYTIAFHQDDQDTIPLVRCSDSPLELRRLDVEPWSGPELLRRIGVMQRHTWPEPVCPVAPPTPSPSGSAPRTEVHQ